MTWRTTLISGLTGLLATLALAAPAAAYCDLLSYKGQGLSQQEALSRANNKGLVRVRQLDAQYGKRVKYDKAAWTCSGGSHVTCTITQRYCIAGLDDKTGGGGDRCGPGKLRLEGKCIRKSDAASYCGPGFRVAGDKCVRGAYVDTGPRPKDPRCPKGLVWSQAEGCHEDD